MKKFLACCLVSLAIVGCKGGHHHSPRGNLYLFCSTNELGEVIVQVKVPEGWFGLLAEADADGNYGPADVFVADYTVNKGMRPAGTYSFQLELNLEDELGIDLLKSPKNPFLRHIVEYCSVQVNPIEPPEVPPEEPPVTPVCLTCSVNTNDGCVSITVNLEGQEGTFTVRRLDNAQIVGVVNGDTVLSLNLDQGSYTFQLLNAEGTVVAQCTVTVPGEECSPPDDNDSTPCPDLVTICHTTHSGQQRTLVLPRPAAEAHLANHPNDSLGACEDDDEDCSLRKGNKRCIIKKKHLKKWLDKHWKFCQD